MRKRNFFSRLYKNNPIICAVVGIVFIVAVYKTYKKAQDLKRKAKDQINNGAITSGVNAALSSQGVTGVRAQIVTLAAENIYQALFKYFLGMFENEAAAEAAFKTLANVNEAVTCAMIYRSSYNRGLWDDLEQYCSFTLMDGVSNANYNAIKGV